MEALLNRRLDCNFNGYRVPVVPRASRSARGRGRIRKKCGDNQIRAFEILARVAGKFLQEGESCNATFPEDPCDVKTWGQRQDDGQFPKMDTSDRESCYKETLSMPQLRGQRNCYSLKKSLDEQENYIAEGPLVSEHFDHSQAMSVAEELDAVNSKNVHRCPGEAFPRTWKHFEGQLESGTDRDFEAGSLNIGSTNSESVPLHGSLEDSMDLDINQHSGASVSGSNTKASVLRDCIAIGSFPGCSSDTNVVSKGSDKNSVGDSLHDTLTKPCRPLSYIGDQRMGATPASKHWKLKGRGFFKSDGKSKPIYCSGRMRYNDSERSEMIFPFKKRKFFNQNELSTSTRAFHCEDVFDSSGERTNSYSCGSATGASSSAADQQASPESRDCNVKLSIKSFKVPELFIEIPTTATIGSLKRTVMEAVTARLRDGLHVGILLQGKKVSDDSKTLMQTGISQDNMHHSLGFMLEPRHAQNLPPHCTEDLPFSSISKLGEPIRHKTSSALQPKTSSAAPVPPEISFGSCSGADFGKVLSIAEPSTNNTVSDSRALVAVPAITMEALAVVPFHRKTGHPEFGKRRMRRPFSVPEVEALVQAVEKLGTGRWRDVKMRAFDNASHRTYVDLKDKWKTLVHTARISPQQRRGEPVPQELLDRVLAAHAYWSHHHERQPLKAAI